MRKCALQEEVEKFAEESLKKAKEIAEEATKLKDKFVSLVAHDLRSPFNSIMGYLKLLQQAAALCHCGHLGDGYRA
ncbi:MAG: hypothetical protein HZA01_16950 [Nitrospinae bacterium]|nr:hypothetical protein [Nitrospinota bacterium]